MAAGGTAVKTERLFSFFQLCGKLKHLKRAGWVNYDVHQPETVSGHMYRMAMMGFLFSSAAGDTVDRDRCIRMALVHDLAESIVGDITPDDGVSKEEKYRRELDAMEHIKSLVPEEVGMELFDLWKEYEEAKSPEAVIVKDLDKFDMIFQAFEYERSQNRPQELQQFFDSTKGSFQHPMVRTWVDELLKERSCAADKPPEQLHT